MPRSGAYIMRSGSFEATITASEGNITFGHSGSVKFVDAVSGSVAELTSSLSGSTMQTEWILGDRVASSPFWVFKPDGRIQYSKGGTSKVTEIDLAEKFLYVTRSSHDAVDKFENYEISERDSSEKKGLVKGGANTYDSGIIISGSSPFLSLFNTSTNTLNMIRHDRMLQISGGFPWSIGTSINGNESYFGGNDSIGLGNPPSLFWFSSSGDFWTGGDISASGNIYTEGNIYANEYHTSYNSSSVIFSSGSTIFGDTTNDTHQFTGSVNVYGWVNGTGIYTDKLGVVAAGGEPYLEVANNFDVSIGDPQGAANETYLTIDDTNENIQTSKKLTVEGDISASGDIFADEMTFGGTDTSENLLHYPLIKKAGNNLVNYTNGFSFNPSTDILTIGGTSTFSGNDTDINRDLQVGRNISLAAALIHTGDIGTKIAYTTGKIELSAGEIELSAPVTVTGDVSASGTYFGKHFYYTHHGFYVNGTYDYSIPMNSLSENRIDYYYHRFIAPFNGRLVKVMIKAQGVGGNATVSFATSSDGTENTTPVASSGVGVSMTAADTTYTWNMSSTYCSFNEGETLSVHYQGAATSLGCSATCVWEYDTGGQ